VTSAATFKIVRLPRPRGDGKYTIYLRISCAGRNRYRTLNRHATLEEWNDDTCRFTKQRPEWRVETDILRMYKQRGSDILRGYERDGVGFDFDQFEADMFAPKAKPGKSPGLAEYATGIADSLIKDGREGNAQAYISLAHIVALWKPSATLGDVKAPWLAKFEAYLRTDRSQKPGTISFYMRTLRATCNHAAKSGTMRTDWNPFSDYSLAHLSAPTAKRAIKLDDVRRIMAAEAQNSDEALAIDLFAFSLYARGMNMVDIAYLSPDMVAGDRIEYTRRKTGKRYSVALNEHTTAMLAKYSVEGSEYCFPILSDFHQTEKQRRERIHRVTVKTNKALRDIAKRLGMRTAGLSFYTARHTYATALKERGVSIEVISESLGHADLRTTQIYLRSFDNSVLDDADKLLL